MARRARVHSRDIQPQIVAPKGLFAAARVQRLDFPLTIPTTNIDELGRRLHVGTTTDIPDVRVSFEAFDVSHNTFAYLTGYTPATFPASGASVSEFKNIDVVGQIRDANTSSVSRFSIITLQLQVVKLLLVLPILPLGLHAHLGMLLMHITLLLVELLGISLKAQTLRFLPLMLH
jgi:hypothetical protein